ncbi:MAG: hypothetical protein AUJ98_05400 [Bacteroidetes bacterium CG2_30_33_31]|nr:MAG: hypothetical protein AUJ98_05400 [Bacteroidetes bacterium CG2_30_33_31]
MSNRGIILLLMTLTFSACNSYNYNVLKVDENTLAPKKFGYYYSLPRNVISIDITVLKTKKIAGPYATFADKYLGIKNAPQINSVKFEMTDIKINSYAEPDPEQFYFVGLGKFKNSKAHAMMLRMNESGIIQDVNDNSDALVLQEKINEKEKSNIDYTETFKYFADANLREQIDTIIEKVNMDTGIVVKQILKRSLVEKTLEEKASEAANFITKVKQERLDILTGAQEVAYTDASLRLMNDELSKLEDEYMMLFTGTSQTETFHYRYTYLPESQIYNASVPLFKFSNYAGVVDDKFQGGEIVYIQINRAKNTINLGNFAKNNLPDKTKNIGFYYRVPEYSKFSIIYQKDLKAEASFLISQFGVVLNLPAVNNKIQFFPNTGAIRKVEVK